MPTDAPNTDRAQVAALGAVAVPHTEIQRLTDEVAYLTRDRTRWRDRALQAEARLGVRVGCGGVA